MDLMVKYFLAGFGKGRFLLFWERWELILKNGPFRGFPPHLGLPFLPPFQIDSFLNYLGGLFPNFGFEGFKGSLANKRELPNFRLGNYSLVKALKGRLG